MPFVSNSDSANLDTENPRSDHIKGGSNIALVVDVACPDDLKESAEEFSRLHEVPIQHVVDPELAGYFLVYDESGLSLLQTGKGAPGPISASFVQGKNLHRMRHGGGKGQLVAKAVGLNKGVCPHILDVTAGLGRDAFVLATLGCSVDLFERVPAVEALLQFAIDEAQSSKDPQVADAARRMNLRFGDALSFLREANEPVADVIYLDPMYPERNKSAAVKKEMRAFHDLVGANNDDYLLLEEALKKARYRVVVKRPRKGDAIAGVKPSLVLEGKSSRYDIYTIRRLEGLATR
jgi:16S rRNA (guanine1516-N2)-methyltransferase